MCRSPSLAVIALPLVTLSLVACSGGGGPPGRPTEGGALVDAMIPAGVDLRGDAGADAGRDGGTGPMPDAASPPDGPSTCAGQCVPLPPNGWTFTAYAASARPACPAAYARAGDTWEGPTGAPASCNCTCTVRQSPTCTPPASASLRITQDGTCGTPTSQTWTLPASSTCVNPGSPIAYNNPNSTLDLARGSFAGTPAGGSCNAPSVSRTVPPLGGLAGRSCGLTATPGGGCGIDACLTVPGPGFALCIERSGSFACPPDYPNKHTAADAIDDTRGCSTCECAATADCSGGELSIYDGTDCQGTRYTFVNNNNCLQVGRGPVIFRSYKTVPPIPQKAACAPKAGFGPTGSVSVVSARTICCS